MFVSSFSFLQLSAYLLAPIFFLLWNAWNMTRHLKKIMNTWKKKEAHLLKEWSLKVIQDTETEIRSHARYTLQQPFPFYAIVFLCAIGLPYLSHYSGLAYYPLIGWVWLLLWIHVRLQLKAALLLKHGIPFHQVVVHPRIQQELRIPKELKEHIPLPFLFVKSYQRTLAIQEEFSIAIRKSSSPDEGKMLTNLLTREEKALVQDMNNALMGRVQKYQKDAGFSEALSTLLTHAWDSSLPTVTRYHAMELAEELERRGDFPERGFQKQYDPLLDIQQIEEYFRP